MPHQLGHGPQPGAETLPRDRVDCSAFNTDLAEFSRLLPAPDRRGIRCVEHHGSSLCYWKELRRKPYHTVVMVFLYLSQIAATNFLHSSIRRHFKDTPPLPFFGPLRDP